jgi:hypothetical protein
MERSASAWNGIFQRNKKEQCDCIDQHFSINERSAIALHVAIQHRFLKIPDSKTVNSVIKMTVPGNFYSTNPHCGCHDASSMGLKHHWNRISYYRERVFISCLLFYFTGVL